MGLGVGGNPRDGRRGEANSALCGVYALPTLEINVMAKKKKKSTSSMVQAKLPREVLNCLYPCGENELFVFKVYMCLVVGTRLDRGEGCVAKVSAIDPEKFVVVSRATRRQRMNS